MSVVQAFSSDVQDSLQDLLEQFVAVDPNFTGFVSSTDFMFTLLRNGCSREQAHTLLGQFSAASSPSSLPGSVNYRQMLRYLLSVASGGPAEAYAPDGNTDDEGDGVDAEAVQRGHAAGAVAADDVDHPHYASQLLRDFSSSRQRSFSGGCRACAVSDASPSPLRSPSASLGPSLSAARSSPSPSRSPLLVAQGHTADGRGRAGGKRTVQRVAFVDPSPSPPPMAGAQPCERVAADTAVSAAAAAYARAFSSSSASLPSPSPRNAAFVRSDSDRNASASASPDVTVLAELSSPLPSSRFACPPAHSPPRMHAARTGEEESSRSPPPLCVYHACTSTSTRPLTRTAAAVTASPPSPVPRKSAPSLAFVARALRSARSLTASDRTAREHSTATSTSPSPRDPRGAPMLSVPPPPPPSPPPPQQPAPTPDRANAAEDTLSLREIYALLQHAQPLAERDGLLTLQAIRAAFAQRQPLLGVSPDELDALIDSLGLDDAPRTHRVRGAVSRERAAGGAEGGGGTISPADFCVLVSRLRPAQIQRVRRAAPWTQPSSPARPASPFRMPGAARAATESSIAHSRSDATRSSRDVRVVAPQARSATAPLDRGGRLVGSPSPTRRDEQAVPPPASAHDNFYSARGPMYRSRSPRQSEQPEMQGPLAGSERRQLFGPALSPASPLVRAPPAAVSPASNESSLVSVSPLRQWELSPAAGSAGGIDAPQSPSGVSPAPPDHRLHLDEHLAVARHAELQEARALLHRAKSPPSAVPQVAVQSPPQHGGASSPRAPVGSVLPDAPTASSEVRQHQQQREADEQLLAQLEAEFESKYGHLLDRSPAKHLTRATPEKEQGGSDIPLPASSAPERAPRHTPASRGREKAQGAALQRSSRGRREDTEAPSPSRSPSASRSPSSPRLVQWTLPEGARRSFAPPPQPRQRAGWRTREKITQYSRVVRLRNAQLLAEEAAAARGNAGWSAGDAAPSSVSKPGDDRAADEGRAQGYARAASASQQHSAHMLSRTSRISSAVSRPSSGAPAASPSERRRLASEDSSLKGHSATGAPPPADGSARSVDVVHVSLSDCSVQDELRNISTVPSATPSARATMLRARTAPAVGNFNRSSTLQTGEAAGTPAPAPAPPAPAHATYRTRAQENTHPLVASPALPDIGVPPMPPPAAARPPPRGGRGVRDGLHDAGAPPANEHSPPPLSSTVTCTIHSPARADAAGMRGSPTSAPSSAASVPPPLSAAVRCRLKGRCGALLSACTQQDRGETGAIGCDGLTRVLSAVAPELTEDETNEFLRWAMHTALPSQPSEPQHARMSYVRVVGDLVAAEAAGLSPLSKTSPPPRAPVGDCPNAGSPATSSPTPSVPLPSPAAPNTVSSQLVELHRRAREGREQLRCLLRAELAEVSDSSNARGADALCDFFFDNYDDTHTGYLEEPRFREALTQLFIVRARRPIAGWLLEQLVLLARTPFTRELRGTSEASSDGSSAVALLPADSRAEKDARARVHRLPPLLWSVMCDYRYLFEELEL